MVSPPHHSQGPLWSWCSYLRTLGSDGLEAPGPKTRTQLEFHWKPSVHFRLSCQWMNRQDKGLYIIFARVTGPEDHEELGCCSTVGGRKECVWNPGDLLGCLLGFSVPSKMSICTTMAWKALEGEGLGHPTRLAP